MSKSFSKIFCRILVGVLWISGPVLFAANEKVSHPSKVSPKTLACLPTARAAIAPPLTRDTELGDALVEVVAKELIARHSLICDTKNIINQDEARKAFDLIGMSSYFTLAPERIYSSQIKFLMESLAASHIIFVTPNKDKNLIHIDIRAIENMEDNESLSKTIQEFDLHYNESTQFLPKTPKIIRLLALLTPNSVTLGNGRAKVNLDILAPYQEVSKSMRGSLPPIISSISFDKIEHYRTYRRSDYGGSFFPSTFLFAINQDHELERGDLPASDPGHSATLHIEAYGGCVTAMAQGSIHTPIGTTSAGIGPGFCLLQKRMDQRNPVAYGTLAIRSILNHRAFINDQWYVYMETDNVSFEGFSLYKSSIAHADSVTRASVGVGYYLADFEHTYTGFWQSL